MDQLIEETKLEGETDVMGRLTEEQELFKSKKIADREDQYHRRRFDRGKFMSPERVDNVSLKKPENSGDVNSTSVPQKRTYQ